MDMNVYLLGVVSLLTDVSSEMIFPLVPIFLTSVLGAPVALLGLIEGIAEATANLLKMASGIYSDKIGKRKPFVFAGYGLSTLVKPIFAFSMIWQHVLVARFLDRVGKGLRGSARDVMVADYTDEKTRGKAFGFRKMMDSLGATLGPLIAFLLLPIFLASGKNTPAFIHTYLLEPAAKLGVISSTTLPLSTGDAYRLLFALAVIPAALAVAVLFFVKEKETGTRKPGWKFDLSGFNYVLKANLAVSFFFSLGTFSYAFFVLRAQDSGMAVAMIPLVYMFYNLIYALAAMPAGSLSDKIGRRAVIVSGYVLFGITCIGFGLARNDFAFWIFFALYGIFMAIMESVQRAYVSDLAPKELRGTALGVYQGMIGFAALPASVIAGFIWELKLFDMRATFLLGALIAFLSIPLFLVFVREKSRVPISVKK